MNVERWMFAGCCSALLACSTADAHREPAADASVTDGGVCTSCGACEETLNITSHLHVAGDVVYADIPPAGGDHNECWTSWGVHDGEVPDERWVHNLEHGGIVYLHHCEQGCADELTELTMLAQGQARAVLMPYAALKSRFAVVAWGHRLVSDCLDIDAFERFSMTHFDRAPESLPDNPPARCE